MFKAPDRPAILFQSKLKMAWPGTHFKTFRDFKLPRQRVHEHPYFHRPSDRAKNLFAHFRATLNAGAFGYMNITRVVISSYLPKNALQRNLASMELI